MIDIAPILEKLATQSPVFHSEAEFQHALAWEIHEQLHGVHVRLEYPYKLPNKPPNKRPAHLDVWVSSDSDVLVIEVKYKTRVLSVEIGDEQFNLLDHSAQDCGRYDFLYDVQRLEQVTRDVRNTREKNAIGYAILLTNEPLYWISSKRNELPNDTAFRLHQHNHSEKPREIHGELKWLEPSKPVTPTRADPINLRGTYTPDWKDYSQVKQPNGKFRYLMMKVLPQ